MLIYRIHLKPVHLPPGNKIANSVKHLDQRLQRRETLLPPGNVAKSQTFLERKRKEKCIPTSRSLFLNSCSAGQSLKKHRKDIGAKFKKSKLVVSKYFRGRC